MVSSSENEIVVDFTLGGFNLTRVSTPNGTQHIVSVPKMAPMLEAGAPDLPQFPVPAIIGDLAEMQVSVTKSTFTDYENVEIAPSKGNLSRQIDPESVPYSYGEMYSQNAFYPVAQAHLEAPYILRDFRGQNIMVTPFAYNPVTKTLRVYTHMTIAMTKVSDNGVNQKVTRKGNTVKIDPEQKAQYRRRFINFGETSAKYTFDEDYGELLIICADMYMSNLQPLVDWKIQSGRPTTLVSLSTAGGNNTDNIRNYVSNFYNDPSHNLEYLLLVGEYNDITPKNLGNGQGGTVYSDIWFGKLEGNDDYPEILVGRFSVADADDADLQVNKTIYYERDVVEGAVWGNKGMGIGCIGAGSGHYGEDDYVHIDYIRDTLLHYTYEQVTEHHGGGDASVSTISATINEGISIINYCNHGSETSWVVANYTTSNVAALTNDGMLPVVWSVACLNGKFDNGTCFAESWLRAKNNATGAPTGAVAGMFSYVSQPWIPPMYGQDEMVDILTEWRSVDKFHHTIGGASLNGSMYVLDMAPGDSYQTFNAWLLFGDPSALIRTDIPASMNIDCSPAVLMLGMTNLQITAEDTNCGIATLMMDGEVIASGNISDGICTLQFAPLNNVGTATLTVIGYNKATEVMPIEVLPAEGPYITVANHIPNFAPINTTTNLTLSFKNVGVDPTVGNTEVTLTCDDSRLSFLNNTASFGILNAEEITTLSNAFSFIVAEGVEDGTRFQIDAEMTDGSQTWNSKFFITAGQAILDYVGTDWAGSFVPGTTVTLAANFKNTGHYMATNAVASMSCESEYVTVLNPTIEMGTIDPEGIGTCVFNIQIASTCPETEQIPVNFTMQADGGISAEGSLTMKNTCFVVFELEDSWGDGWNGASLTVSFNDGTPNVNLTCQSSSKTEVLEIANGTLVSLTWNRGSYDSECSFTVKYQATGETIYQVSNPRPGLLHEFNCDCAAAPIIGGNSPVENLNYTVDMENIILTWDAATDAIDYTVMRNGVTLGTTEENTFIDQVYLEATYTYCVIANYESVNSLPECIVVEAEWGIDENMSEFSIYPNPANGTLFINGGNAEYSYSMYNGMGQVVANGTAKGTEQISVDGMTKGVYFLRLTSGTQVLVEKVVVK